MKPKKFPNKIVDKDNPIIIPDNIDGKLTIGGKEYPTYGVKSFTYSAPLTDDFFKRIKVADYVEENTTVNSINSMPWFYTPNERLNSEIANLRFKSKQLLDSHYSTGKLINEFGNSKFPKNCTIECNKCIGFKLELVVDFFVHCISDHGKSLQNTVNVFNGILDRIQAHIQ